MSKKKGNPISSLIALLNTQGPVVRCIVLHASGTQEERSIDMTPRENNPAKMLGATTCTFVGPIPALDAVVMVNADQALPCTTSTSSPHRLAHRLPPPLQDATFSGDALIIRMDKNSEPQDLTLEEYNHYCQSCEERALTLKPKRAKSAMGLKKGGGKSKPLKTLPQPRKATKSKSQKAVHKT